MRITDLALRDFHSVPNALMRGSSDPAMVSFEVEWKNVLKEGEIRNQQERFRLEFVETDVAIQWSGKNLGTGFSFTSNVGSRATSAALGQTGFAMLAEERNGVFFRKKKKDNRDENEDD